MPSPSVNKHSYYKALAQISEPDFLFRMVANCKCALSSGIKPCHSSGCCAMCGRELPLGAPSAAASPFVPAASRGTGKDLLKF